MGQQVTVGVRSEDWAKARALLHPDVRVVELASDDAWIRDSGPTFVVKVRHVFSVVCAKIHIVNSYNSVIELTSYLSL